MSIHLRLLLLSAALSATAASAAETQSYSYDSLGRLVGVIRSGSVNNGVQSRYMHDSADNRSNLTVTGTGRAAPAISGGARAAATGQASTAGGTPATPQ